MSDEDKNPIGRGTTAGSLDLSDPKDIALLNQSLKNRPSRFRGVSEDLKNEIVDGLRESNRLARSALTNPGETFEAIDKIVAVANVVVRMVGIDQRDDHHAVDAARGAGENRTENKIVVIQAPSARTMGELRKIAETPKGEP